MLDDLGGVVRHLDTNVRLWVLWNTAPAYSKHNLMAIDQLNEFMCLRYYLLETLNY